MTWVALGIGWREVSRCRVQDDYRILKLNRNPSCPRGCIRLSTFPHLWKAGSVPSPGLASDQCSLEGAKFQGQIRAWGGASLAFQ